MARYASSSSRASHLRRIMHHQLDSLLRAPVRRPRRARGQRSSYASRRPRRHVDRTAARRAPSPITHDEASRSSSPVVSRHGSPALPEDCTAPGRVPVESPRHCAIHGWTARLRQQPEGDSEDELVQYYALLNNSPSPNYTPASPVYTPTPASPPETLLRGTLAARRGAPPFYMAAGGSTNAAADYVDTDPETPPPTRNFIKTGHTPAGTSAHGGVRRSPPPGEGAN